jgi:hypothetical protein
LKGPDTRTARARVVAFLVLAGCVTGQTTAAPSAEDAQRVWRAYWSAVERGDAAEWNRTVHSTLRTSEQGFDPNVQADARSFLIMCSIEPQSAQIGGDRAAFRTRCATGPTRSGLYPLAGAELVLRRDVDGAWRFFCLGCGLPYRPQPTVGPPSPEEAQRLWVAYWSAVERGDLDEARSLEHSSLRGKESPDIGRPEMRALARDFLYSLSVRPVPPIVTEDRARYRTRQVADDRDSGPMFLQRDRDAIWRVMCFGNCEP